MTVCSNGYLNIFIFRITIQRRIIKSHNYYADDRWFEELFIQQSTGNPVAVASAVGVNVLEAGVNKAENEWYELRLL